MVLRFGKTVDWTSRNTAIRRISLDDISYACSRGCDFCCFFLKCSRTVFAHLMFLGSENSLQTWPSTLTEVYCEPFFSTVVQGKSL